MDFTPFIAPTLFVATVIGWAIKYGADQQTLKSKNTMQDMEIENLKKTVESNQAHNLKQHEDFYDNRTATIELKADMKHIMSSIDQIKQMLERRREPRE